jgi:hypothetical protein
VTLVECYGLRLHQDTLIGRRVEVPLAGHPDSVAAEAIGLRGSAVDGIAVLHSTSWRWDDERATLILTYVCAPDPSPSAISCGLVLARRGEGSDNPSRPSPQSLDHAAVLDHAVSHLAWLAEHHPATVAAARSMGPPLWNAVQAAGTARAGQLLPHAYGSSLRLAAAR